MGVYVLSLITLPATILCLLFSIFYVGFFCLNSCEEKKPVKTLAFYVPLAHTKCLNVN